MRVLCVHNHYQSSSPSGEGTVFRAEVSLLQEGGHEVQTYERSNDELLGLTRLKLATRGGLSATWNRRSYGELASRIASFSPDVVHFHNTFPLISPAGYYACHRAGVPVVQTVHNYRLLCANGLFFREGQVCEECLERGSWRGIRHGCYRGSRSHTVAATTATVSHRLLGTLSRTIDQFIVLTDFARAKLSVLGLSEERFFVKPNFVDDPGANESFTESPYFAFVGRLDEMKGTRQLVEAARSLPDARFVVVGSGPLEDWARREATDNVTFTGMVPLAEARRVMAGATALLVPSLLYEGFPRTVVEAYASGTPVIASGHGALAEVVEPAVTGLHCVPGSGMELAAQCLRVMSDPRLAESLGENAWQRWHDCYSPQVNLAQLEAAYARAKEVRNGR